MSRLGGLQKDALSMYRAILRAIRAKPGPDTQASLRLFARSEFERHRHISNKNFQLVEHLLRKGRKQMALLQSGSVVGLIQRDQAA